MLSFCRVNFHVYSRPQTMLRNSNIVPRPHTPMVWARDTNIVPRRKPKASVFRIGSEWGYIGLHHLKNGGSAGRNSEGGVPKKKGPRSEELAG